MANSQVCIFCGKSVGFFSGSSFDIGNMSYPCCGSCYKEMQKLTPLEVCRQALQAGFVEATQPIHEQIAFLEQADEKRPRCSMCGSGMHFRSIRTLDASPMRDSIFTSTFDVLPMYCPNCCKMELFWPEMLEKNKELAYLYRIDCK